MKKIILALVALLATIQVAAQGQRRFDPNKFEAEMEQFITTEACLSPQDAAAFFPLYKEMHNKQRGLFGQMRRFRHVDMSDDKACKEAIEKRDALDLQIKEIQQQYHKKFIKILAPSKVFKIIRAEERFHRQAMRRAARGNRPQ